MFILGDDRNTSDPTSQKRRSTSRDYYNGPLESVNSIFQRIIFNLQVDIVFVCNHPLSNSLIEKEIHTNYV